MHRCTKHGISNEDVYIGLTWNERVIGTYIHLNTNQEFLFLPLKDLESNCLRLIRIITSGRRPCCFALLDEIDRTPTKDKRNASKFGCEHSIMITIFISTPYPTTPPSHSSLLATIQSRTVGTLDSPSSRTIYLKYDTKQQKT